jgi:hypothetical protein
MIPPVFATLSVNVDVTDLIDAGTSCRCYPFGFAPQGTTIPYVSWDTISGEPLNRLSSGSFVDRLGARIDCWSNTDAQALEVADAVRTALESVGNMVSDNPSDRDEQTGLVRYSMTFEFFV